MASGGDGGVGADGGAVVVAAATVPALVMFLLPASWYLSLPSVMSAAGGAGGVGAPLLLILIVLLLFFCIGNFENHQTLSPTVPTPHTSNPHATVTPQI